MNPPIRDRRPVPAPNGRRQSALSRIGKELNFLNDPDVWRAARSGFADSASLGLIDPVTSAWEATVKPSQGEWKDRYASRMRGREAEDARDARDYGAARMVGQGAGTAAAILGGELIAPVAIAGRTAKLASAAGKTLPRVGHAVRVGAASGAASGVGGEIALGLVTGRPGDWRDHTSAALGGAVGGAATRFVGPSAGAAIDAGATTAANALMHGRLPEVGAVLADASRGAAIGGVLGRVGIKRTDGLTNTAKGKLGERLSEINTKLRGDSVSGRQKRVNLKGGGYTVVDHTTRRGDLVEAKMGYSYLKRPPSKRQQQAINEGLQGYGVQIWTPDDIGGMAGVSGASVLVPVYDNLVANMEPSRRQGR